MAGRQLHRRTGPQAPWRPLTLQRTRPEAPGTPTKSKTMETDPKLEQSDPSGSRPSACCVSPTVIAALLEAHGNTCRLIESLPVLCRRSRKRLIRELVDITCAIDDFSTPLPPGTPDAGNGVTKDEGLEYSGRLAMPEGSIPSAAPSQHNAKDMGRATDSESI